MDETHTSSAVWVLWHVPEDGDPGGEAILIGVYSARQGALAAVERLASKPGFRDNPALTEEPGEPGFFLDRYTLDQDHWTEGYRTEPGEG